MVIEIGHVGLVVLAEERELVGPAEILNIDPRIRLSALGSLCFRTCYETGDISLLRLALLVAFCNQGVQFRQRTGREVLDFELVFLQGMLREIHSHDILLLLQKFQSINLSRDNWRFRLLCLQFFNLSEK